MSFREVLNVLLVPSVHSALTLQGAEETLINYESSLCSLRSLKQTYSLGKLVVCANTSSITEDFNQYALDEMDNFFGFTTPEANHDIFNDFFNQAELAGLELLADDKRWLRAFGYWRINKGLFSQYIKHWLDAMNNEQRSFKKQNKGRYAANTFIREALEHFNHQGK